MSTLSELASYVRDLTGVYYSDVISDNLIYRFLNEAYLEVCVGAPWPWLERQDYLDLVAGTHLVETESGVSRIQEVVVRSADSTIQVKAKPVVSTLAFSEDQATLSAGMDLFYDREEGSIDIYPALHDDAVVEVRYQEVPGNLAPYESPRFATAYHPALAYRAAWKVLMIQADDSPRFAGYEQEFAGYLDRMSNEYLLDYDEGMFQLGDTEHPGIKRR